MGANSDLEVIKRDASVEPFSLEKIQRVVRAAGLDDKQTKQLTGEIILWQSRIAGKKISSKEIRDEVQRLMERIDPASANFYRWYQKTKK